MDARPALTHRAHCRACSSITPGTFAGWVTDTGIENTIRPRAFYRSCAQCGLIRMVLGGDQGVTDAEGFARTILDEHLIPVGGRATATGTPDGPAHTDWEAALWFLVDTIWRLYAEKWDPAVGMPFKSYAAGLGRRRLDGWIRDESGEASGRSKGRVHPKAHAASVSISLDAIDERGLDLRSDERDDSARTVGERTDDHSGLAAPERAGARDFADDRSPDLAWALATGDR